MIEALQGTREFEQAEMGLLAHITLAKGSRSLQYQPRFKSLILLLAGCPRFV